MTPFISHDRLSELIGSIYDCALDPGLWPATLDDICRELDLCTGVVSLIRLADGRPLLAAATGFAPEWLSRIDDHAEGLVTMWGGQEAIHALPLHEPAVLSRVNPAAIAEDSRDPFHVQFNRPQGFVDAIAVGVSRDVQTVGTIGFNRHREAGLVGSREIEVMRLLVPHLQRAITVSRVLDVQKIAIRNMEDVLSGLGMPIVLVTRSLGILFANRAAEHVMAAGGLERRAGRLVLQPAGMQRALEAALAQAPERGAAGDRNPFGIPLVAEDGQPGSVHVLPLGRRPPVPERSEYVEKEHGQDGGQASSLMQEESFALIFTSGSQATDNACPLMTSLFGLTVGEGRVLEHLLAGLTIQQTAGRLAVSPSTVRTHLLHIFEKTGVHRQVELVALAASLSSIATRGA